MIDLFGAKEVAAIAKEFLAPVGGTLNDVWQGLIGDRISHYRLKNAMSLQRATNAEASRLGLTLNSARIPDRYVFAWFEEATKQDEPEIQILFARLLARAASGDSDAEDRRLISALKEMTPNDAAIFQRIYSDQPFPDMGLYSETKAIGATGGFASEAWPRDWAVFLLNHFHLNVADTCVERLITIGCLGTAFRAEGHQKHPILPTGKQVGKSDWERFVRDTAALRAYITATSIGASLARAVKE
jgi:hypothetical protein